MLVLDDVTPLIRAQRVAAWRDVARRLAHEIKNPLTPIQLSAERLRRHFGQRAAADAARSSPSAPTRSSPRSRRSRDWSTSSRSSRGCAGRACCRPTSTGSIDETLQLYAGVLQQGTLRVERQFAGGLPPVRLDAEQMRQVIINLVDNAIEALGGPHAPPRPDGAAADDHASRRCTTRATASCGSSSSDNGPGVPPADRDKLFMPYYSTKGRGSGLGLAIVRRIIVEHGGGIEVGPALPSARSFTIEMPEA